MSSTKNSDKTTEASLGFEAKLWAAADALQVQRDDDVRWQLDEPVFQPSRN